eukprot:2937319-Prymnesium_polylepis.3
MYTSHLAFYGHEYRRALQGLWAASGGGTSAAPAGTKDFRGIERTQRSASRAGAASTAQVYMHCSLQGIS